MYIHNISHSDNHFVFYRLSGVIHILYKALSQTLGNDQDSLIESDSDSMHVDDQPSEYITEEEAQMAVVLMEYFQEQRRVYEQVR